jgi:ribosomal protein S18 acetylase RimI-like enzyme
MANDTHANPQHNRVLSVHQMAQNGKWHLTTSSHRDKNVGIVKAREARSSDRSALEALLKRARYASPTLWQWEPHLTDEGFIVLEKETHAERSRTNRIGGALLASADASPVAWIRLAAVDPNVDVEHWLDLSLPPILGTLSNRGVHELAWMDYGEWAGGYLNARGFSPLVDVITLAKTDRRLPDAPVGRAVEPKAAGVTLRSAMDADLAAIVAIDRAAFEPHWWRSEATVRRRAATASRFTVAECRGELTGYTEREHHLPTGHLNRIAIHPHSQGLGIGAILLRHVLHAMWQSGASTVSLNTQRHNLRSRRLYELFGFETTGDAVTVWTLHPISPRSPSARNLNYGHR